MLIPPVNMIDFYKADHRSQYPKNTQLVLSNLTARKSRLEDVKETVFFGLQYFLKEYLQKQWDRKFFNAPKEFVVRHYKRRLENALGKGVITYKHIEDLHDLGYLPLEIMAVSEGELVPIGVPSLILFNTKPEFFWLTNYLETILSCSTWQSITSATLAWRYRKLLSKYNKMTTGNDDFTPFQAHDFSFRGMSSMESAAMSGGGHLLSFVGSDTVIAGDYLEEYYNADCEEELLLTSVRAGEHSTVCAGSKENEIETLKRLITEVYPTGIYSHISDSWDYWQSITEFLPLLKNEILGRDGKLVIRGDSGEPTDIICGTCREFDKGQTPAEKGTIECLWNIFGGDYTKQGYRTLNPKIGMIYGDSITYDRAKDICERLTAKGFATTNVVLGVGSFSYAYNTRDTFGMALKATMCQIDGKDIEIFKDPKTDSGMKKSAKGLTAVFRDTNGKLYLKDQATWEEVRNCELKTVFKDGKLLVDHTLREIRERLLSNLK